jgi:HSP20 family protein
MSLVRWDPFSEMDTLFNRMLPTAFGGWPRFSREGDAKFEWSPSADISETTKEFLIRAELPAVNKEDVKVTVDRGMITIEGERKQQKEDKDEKFHRVERFHGSFMRSFALPENVDIDAIRCEDKNGVLTVHIPKTESGQQKPKLIKVQ